MRSASRSTRCPTCSRASEHAAAEEHLAALGLAVSKVSHDLRNMLSSAQLSPTGWPWRTTRRCKRFAPKLIVSLDRAIGFLTQTLKFGRAQEPPPERERLPLGSWPTR